MTQPRLSVIYYSATGTMHALAQALAAGARDAGADVRLRRVAETAPAEAIETNPAWRAHLEHTADIPQASHDDLTWADAYAFGTPTRFGNVAAQLKTFIDSTGPLWAAGQMADKPVTAFAGAQNVHGGNEMTILALYVSMAHWGSIIVPPGYTHDAFGAAGGNPYGTSFASGDGNLPTPEALESASQQGRRLVAITKRLRGS